MILLTTAAALHYGRWLFPLLVEAAIITMSLNADPCAAQVPDATRGDAAYRFDAQEKELEARLAKLGSFAKDQGKEEAEAYDTETERYFTEKFAGNREKEREEVDDIVSSADKGFARTAAWGMIGLLAKEGERDLLVRLLASRCPKYMGIHLGIEDELVIVDRKTLKDGTLVLCDAFDKSNDQHSRATIAAALRRGFTAVGITSNDDPATVKAVRRWYVENATRYRPNLDYLDHFSRPNFSYEKIGILTNGK